MLRYDIFLGKQNYRWEFQMLMAKIIASLSRRRIYFSIELIYLLLFFNVN